MGQPLCLPLRTRLQACSTLWRISFASTIFRGVFEAGSKPPTGANKFGAFIGRKRGIAGAGTAAVWDSAELIRDPYSGAAKGEIAVTMHLPVGFGIPPRGKLRTIEVRSLTMSAQVEHRAFDLELRAGQVIGTAMVYGDHAELGRGVSEVFTPGALRPTDSVTINVAHKAAEIVAERVEVRDDGNTLQVLFGATERVKSLVRDGYDRMSIEFRAVQESFDSVNFIRTISEAVLSGVALVKSPAYHTDRR